MRTTKLILVLVMAALICCGGGNKTAAKSTGDKTGKPATGTAAAPAATGSATAAGLPPESFTELTDAEMTSYVKVLPEVGKALKAASYKPKDSDKKDMAAALTTAIDGIKSVPGVDAALQKAGMTWPQFRTTTFKVMSATMAMAMEFAEALVKGMSNDSGEAKESKEAKEAKAEIAKARVLFSGVPKKNQEMIMAHTDDLKALGDLEPK